INGNGGNDVLVILPNGTIAVVDGITGQLAAVAGLDFNGDGFKDVLLIAPSGAPRTFFDGKTGRSFSLGG
ncbi:MAG: FG-GAP repeat protein, partial [Planctomycetes bacterium]|nr:FG-GAP repeat protein [Planctomycetota bacterium]